MATLFSDNFNRADSATVDATNWQENGTAEWSIVSNRVESTAVASPGPGTLLTTASAHVAVADCKATITQVATGSDGGPLVRWTAGARGASARGYALDCSTGLIEIYRYDTSGTGVLLRTASNTQVANAVLRLEATGTGPSVLLRQFYNGIQIGADVSDGSAVAGGTGRVLAAGRTGIHNWLTAISDYDNFIAEDFSASAIRVTRPFPFRPGSPPSQNPPYR